jgi:ABC-type methionine transport system ATPase subunit
LSNDPPLLLADEPTGNLDSSTGRQIIELLLSVNRSRGTTLVLVTHDPDLAGVAHMSIALRDGRVVSQTGGSGLKPQDSRLQPQESPRVKVREAGLADPALRIARPDGSSS